MSTLFGDESGAKRDAAEQRLIDAYVAADRTLDALPYTDEFERLYVAAGGDAAWESRKEAFHRLHGLRKSGRLPRLGRHGGDAVMVSREEEELVAELVRGAVGSLGRRDQLAFDAKLDELNIEFGRRTGRQLGPYEFWRLVAKVAK
jgi:hypothetical protein